MDYLHVGRTSHGIAITNLPLLQFTGVSKIRFVLCQLHRVKMEHRPNFATSGYQDYNKQKVEPYSYVVFNVDYLLCIWKDLGKLESIFKIIQIY